MLRDDDIRSLGCEVEEWVYGPDDEPMCTAFVPAGDPIPPPKDDRTIDMFGTDPLLNEAIDRLIARGSER